MHLSPRDLDKLVLHQVGSLAQKRLARGLRLNYPEAVGLLSAVLLELIRDGRSVAELMDLGRRILGRRDVMEGVPDMLHEVQVEGTFPDGTKLVTVHDPIVLREGNLTLALYGSFLPIPDRTTTLGADQSPLEGAAGEVLVAHGDLELNADRETARLKVTNTGDRPIQVGSHYHFAETNRALSFNRTRAYGMRLDIPSGAAVRFEPGETKTVRLVEIAGRRVVHGGNELASGPVDETKRARIADEAAARNFAHLEDA